MSDAVAIAIAGIVGTAALGPLVNVWVDGIRYSRDTKGELAREARVELEAALDAVHEAERQLVNLRSAVTGDHGENAENVWRAWQAYAKAQEPLRLAKLRLAARLTRDDPLVHELDGIMKEHQSTAEPAFLLIHGGRLEPKGVQQMLHGLERVYELRDAFADTASDRLAAGFESQRGRK